MRHLPTGQQLCVAVDEEPAAVACVERLASDLADLVKLTDWGTPELLNSDPACATDAPVMYSEPMLRRFSEAKCKLAVLETNAPPRFEVQYGAQLESVRKAFKDVAHRTFLAANE
eukprot:3787326-Pyramimonas_sp.AAC.1